MDKLNRHVQLDMRRKYIAKEYSLSRVRQERDVDSLTGLNSRGFGEQFITDEFRHYVRNMESDVANFGIVYLDVDNFKMINDTYMDYAGDTILKIISSAIKQNIRAEDLGIRWGGDEMIIMLRGGSADELQKIFFGDNKPNPDSKRNIYDGINQTIGNMVKEAIVNGSLPSDFIWPSNADQVHDGRYISAGLVCASEVNSMRALIDESTSLMKKNKKDRKAGR
ncbi:MAG: GGDEF domain-containing protein [Microgenomates group bacterium]